MEHIGIDLGSRTSHICIVESESAKIALESKVETRELAAWLSKRAAAQVAMETCTESFAVADRLADTGHTVRVVPASIVRELGVGRRGIKNDRRDAQVLAKASLALGDELPHVHVPSTGARMVRRHLSQRAALVRTRTLLVNAVKASLRQELIVLSGGSTTYFPKRVRAELQDQELLAALEPTLDAIQQTTRSILRFDTEIAELSKGDSRVGRLKTIPGVGVLISAMFVAVIDNVERFPNGAHLASYMGLTPGENTTGGKTRLTGITRAGQRHLRSLLIQACWTLVRSAPDSALALRYRRLAESKRKQVAIVATARRLCNVMYAMWRDEKNFNSQHGLSALDASTQSSADELAEALRA